MRLLPSDFIADPRGFTSAGYRAAARSDRAAWLTETSPRNLAALSEVRLVVMEAGPSSVRVVVVPAA